MSAEDVENNLVFLEQRWEGRVTVPKLVSVIRDLQRQVNRLSQRIEELEASHDDSE